MGIFDKPAKSVRGQSLRSRLEYVVSQKLPWELFVYSLPDDCRKYLKSIGIKDEQLLSPNQLIELFSRSAWFSHIAYNAFIETSTRLLVEKGMSAVDLNRAAGRLATQAHVKSFLSHVMNFGPITLTLSIIYKAWDQLFTGGEVIVVKNEPGYSEVLIRCSYVTPLFEHIVCGFIEEFLSQKNIPNINIESGYSAHQGGLFHFKIRWNNP